MSNSTNAFAINQTEVDMRLASVPDVVGASPRWTLLGSVSKLNDASVNTSVIVLVINSTREQVRFLVFQFCLSAN